MPTSGSFLDIITAQQHGILSRVSTQLAKSGLLVLKQEIEPLDPGRQRIRFRLPEGAAPPPELKERVESISGVEKVLLPKPSDQQLQELLRGTYSEMVVKVGRANIEKVVGFGTSLPRETRDACLISLGRKIGNHIYQKRYSLGSPLDLGSAISRIVAPELKEFGPVRILAGHQIELDACPFCRKPDAEPSCAYLVGLIRGLLELAPPTSTAQAVEIVCAHENTSGPCVFNMTL